MIALNPCLRISTVRCRLAGCAWEGRCEDRRDRDTELLEAHLVTHTPRELAGAIVSAWMLGPERPIESRNSAMDALLARDVAPVPLPPPTTSRKSYTRRTRAGAAPRPPRTDAPRYRVRPGVSAPPFRRLGGRVGLSEALWPHLVRLGEFWLRDLRPIARAVHPETSPANLDVLLVRLVRLGVIERIGAS